MLLLNQAVDRYGPGYGRFRARYLPDLSGAHALAGDISTAVSIGHQAIDLISAQDSAEARDRLRTLNTVLEQHTVTTSQTSPASGIRPTLRRMDAEVSSSAVAESLRIGMIDQLRVWGAVVTDRVDEAMRAVPRHLFVPDAPLERAYGLDPVVTHRDSDGVAISSASAAGMVGGMLEQADVRAGHRVLEVGTGTGYNAALLAYLVGPAGSVTTIEYDETVAATARHAFADSFGGEVTVVVGDGALGYGDHAPYDRILVTAGAWDIPPAWWEQLAEDGRLVVPLRIRGLTRVIAFERDGEILRSRSIEEDGFIPMRGVGVVVEQNIRVGHGPDLVVRIDDEQAVDSSALSRALDHAPEVSWTGVNAPWAVTEHLDFWLAGMPGFCRILTSMDAVRCGRLVSPKDPWGSMGLFEGGTLAYLTSRQNRDDGGMPVYEIGACAYGPYGADLAARLADRVRDWDRDGGQGIELLIEAHRAADQQPVVLDALLVVEKQYSRIVVRAAGQGASDTA